MCYLLRKLFWWLLRRVKNLRSTTCKHRRKYGKCDVIYRYLHIELIWRLLMVQYLQNNVIMKWTARFIRFTGWVPLKYGSTTTPPVIAHCKKNSDIKRRISYCDPLNLQYKTHPEFWPSHSRIFKTSLYYKSRLILETRRYIDTLGSRFIFYIDTQHEKSCSYINLSWVTYCENMFNISIIDYHNR